jgi:diguanylate cyclase (GGDEF)-like protein/PAS domain S-box-containing protein
MTSRQETLLKNALLSLEHDPDGIFWVDIYGQTVYVNDAACKLLGYSKEELLHMRVRDFDLNVTEEDFGPDGRIPRMVLSKQTTHLETTQQHKDGHLVPVEISMSILNKGGEVYLVSCFVRDLTSQKEAEKRLKEEIEERKSTEQKLENLNKRLGKMVYTDQLTELWTRRYFFAIINKKISKANRHQMNLSMLLLDIDHFKAINDTYGHLIGDAVLVELATLLRHHVAATDSIIRWGGEEFIVILSETDQEHAFTLAENLRSLIAQNDFHTDLPVTVSIGVAQFIPLETVDTWITRTDKALYAAKNAGRNRISTAERPLIGTTATEIQVEEGDINPEN